jgi:hypothetical protein
MTKGVPVEGAPGAVVGLLHEEARESSRMDHSRSNREGMEKRKPARGRAARHRYNPGMPVTSENPETPLRTAGGAGLGLNGNS